MSFSNVSATQRQQQEEALKKILALSLLGSTFLHGVALPFSLKFVKPAEFAEDAIEIVMLDEPKVEETKPEPAIEEKVSPPPETLKPEPPPEPTPPEEQPVAATPPPIPEEPPVATEPPPIPEEQPVAATPPPIPEEPPMAATPPPEIKEELPLTETPPPNPVEPSPPPKEDLNPPVTPQSPIAQEPETPSPDPPKSEPPVTEPRPKGGGSLPDFTDPGNPKSPDSPENNNQPASADSGEPSSEPLNPSSGPIQRSPAAGPPVTTVRPGGRSNSGNASGGLGNLPFPGSPGGSASNSSPGGGGNGGGGSSGPFGRDSGPVPKPTNPGTGGSPSGPPGAPEIACISGCDEKDNQRYYPDLAREEGREGQVELICDIKPNGSTSKITILTHSKYNDLNKAAIKAVQERKYTPSESGIQGERIIIIFRLKKEK